MGKPFVASTLGLRLVRIRWIVIGIAYATTAAFVGAWIFLDRVADSRLEKAIAEADRTDPQWPRADVLANRTHLRVGRVMAAVERFRLEHGRWPDAIHTLAPRFLPAAPVDPFTGHELILKKLDDGLAIYSLGSDQTDNGGRFELRGRDDPGYDLGYRLWNEDARERPPEK
jgi:hypothetical protein